MVNKQFLTQFSNKELMLLWRQLDQLHLFKRLLLPKHQLIKPLAVSHVEITGNLEALVVKEEAVEELQHLPAEPWPTPVRSRLNLR